MPGTYTPPEAGDAPVEVKRILREVYQSCREQNPGEDHAKKEKCAQSAWSAVHEAGYHKNADGIWVKRAAASDIPLLGCLHECQVLGASAGELLLDGAIFTADKVNRNGWGIPSDEAESLAKSLAGKPLRYCPQGKAIPGQPDVPPAHMCDAQGTIRDIVGEILQVYAAGRDEEGRTVYYQKARVTDPETIKGIQTGEVPTSWSLWGYAKRLDDYKMMRQIRGAAGSIVDKPAYREANYQWQKLAAGFFTLNKPDDKKTVTTFGDPIMGDPVPNQAPPAQPPAGEAPQSVQATLNGLPPVTVNNFYPAAGNAQITTTTANASPTGDGKAGQDGEKSKEAPKAKTYTEEELQARVQAALKEHEDQMKRTGLATDVAKLQVAAGLIENKKEMIEAREKDLFKLGASVLETMKADYAKVAEVLQKKAKSGEKPMSAGTIPAGVSAGQAPDEQLMYVLEKFHLTAEDYQKYGPHVYGRKTV